LRMKFYEKTIKNLEFNSLLIPLKDWNEKNTFINCNNNTFCKCHR
jgi:hypothetical protein